MGRRDYLTKKNKKKITSSGAQRWAEREMGNTTKNTATLRRDIDLKFMQDTYRIVLNSLKKNDLHRSMVKVTGTVHCFLKVFIFFHRHILGYSIR